VSRTFLQLERACLALGAADQVRWRQALERLAGRVPQDGPRPRVYVEVWPTPPTAATGCVPELLSWIGADPFLVPPASQSAEVSWEELLEFDPQLVAYAVRGRGTDYAPEAFLKVEGWDRSEAALQGRVFSLAPAPEGGLGLLDWAAGMQALIGEGFWGWPRAQAEGLRRLGGPTQGDRP
jgi:ABC-type Fe3+-hydroxamate transport system substrate-binding protein